MDSQFSPPYDLHYSASFITATVGAGMEVFNPLKT